MKTILLRLLAVTLPLLFVFIYDSCTKKEPAFFEGISYQRIDNKEYYTTELVCFFLQNIQAKCTECPGIKPSWKLGGDYYCRIDSVVDGNRYRSSGLHGEFTFDNSGNIIDTSFADNVECKVNGWCRFSLNNMYVKGDTIVIDVEKVNGEYIWGRDTLYTGNYF